PDSAVVQARLVFDSFSPIPSASLVLSAIASLLSSRSTNLSDAVNVLNFTFE
ncbi:mucin-3A-like isoform X4, partial [Clarias magur]